VLRKKGPGVAVPIGLPCESNFKSLSKYIPRMKTTLPLRFSATSSGEFDWAIPNSGRQKDRQTKAPKSLGDLVSWIILARFS
jgi:hypothetical protein